MSLSLDEDDKKEKKKPEKKEAKGLDDDLGDEIVEKAFDPLNPEGVVLDTEPNKANPSDALTIAGALGTLAGRDLFSDVTFVVGKGGEQRSVPGHRLILAASSDIFEAMLYPPKFPGDKKDAGDGKKPKSSAVSPSKEAKGKDGLGLDKGSLDDEDKLSIEIPDVRPNIFKIMLQAVYSDTADIKPEDLPELIACANKFQLESLRALCVTFMEEGVTAENACKLFETAQELLKEKHFALEFIEEHAEDVARSAGWDTLPKDRLMTILQDDKLCIEEVDLFKAVLRWGLCECKRQGLSDTTDNKKKVLKDILPLIRFPIMMMEEIATFVSPTQLLEAPQLLEIFTYLGKKDKAGASSLKVGFPTRTRGGARDKWALDQNLKWNTVTLSNKDRTAANSGTNHSYCQGTIAWTKGKHAWRVYRDSGNTQWLFIGMARKVNHTQYSYNDATVWGLSSASQQYMASASSSVNTNFASGPLDCLYDADAGTMSITNLTGGQRHDISNLPRGGEGLVPHFGPHSAQTISVYPINIKEVGKADADPRKRA